MKLLSRILAALLLWICIACNQGRNQQRNADVASANKSKQIIVNDVQLEEMKAPPPPAGNQRMQRLETAKIGTVDKESAVQNADGIADDALVATPEKGYDTEDYSNIVENNFLAVIRNPLSTFSIDVDEAAYSNIRRYITEGSLPPPGAVRIEEMINYFDYSYPQPTATDPFSVNTEMAACPWNPQHKLVHIGLQGKEIPLKNLPASNMVFLVDVSGSMDEPNKLPLVKASLKMLTDQLRENDRVAIVVYAGSAGLVLRSTSGSNKIKIKEAIDNLEAGGSTAGGEGIQLAYKTARQHFIDGGNNRIVLATDGDFNVGPSSDDELVRMVEQERRSGVFLSVLGYGMGNYKDNKMQQLADKGNGNHSYIDNINEAKKVLVNEFSSTLFTIAKDVKIQVEFNPAAVKAYRLIGYENRLLADEDFNDDLKDAGELGAGHTVTALYEIIPAGVNDLFTQKVDALKYQINEVKLTPTSTREVMTIKLRYKRPEDNTSMLLAQTVADNDTDLVNTSDNFRFSCAVAEFGMLLRSSAFKQEASYQQVAALAQSAIGKDENDYRKEFIKLVSAAHSLAKN